MDSASFFVIFFANLKGDILVEDGMELRYDDVRKFGRMELVKTEDIAESPSIKKLGFEPDDSRLNADYLIEKFADKKTFHSQMRQYRHLA